MSKVHQYNKYTFMVDIKSFYSNWRTLKWEIKLRGGCGGRSGMTKDSRKR